MQTTNPPATTASSMLSFRTLQTPADALAFRSLNEEWITRFFTLEPKDIATLGDPRTTILAKGGQVYMAVLGTSEAREEVVGCVALIPTGNGVFELSKMAVSPARRGLGIGRKLLEHTIAQARALGATRLFLGSSTRLRNAIHLYESLGFTHVPPDRIPAMGLTRADVFMEHPLTH